jgi:hypothetical protein
LNGIKLEGFDIEKLRERLRKMTDAQLPEFGRAGRQLCSPEANFGKPPREVFVIQLQRRVLNGEEDIRKDDGRTPCTPSVISTTAFTVASTILRPDRFTRTWSPTL